MSTLENERPVRLRAWPPEVFEHESPLGYFVRLAERNAAHSTRVFADSFGLNGRNFNFQELLAFCLDIPTRHRERLVAATPVSKGNLIALNGQTFRLRTDWSCEQPRVCDACLGEEPYYRNWWDLTVLERCPMHDRPLLIGSSSAKLRWWIPGVGITLSGCNLRVTGLRRVESCDSWEAYVLGRMGIIRRATVPIVDDTELFAVIEAAETIGRAAASGWQRRWPRATRMHSAERRKTIAYGYQILRGQVVGLRSFLSDYLRHKPMLEHRGALAFASDDYFGWLSGALRMLPASPTTKLIRDSMNAEAAERGVYSRKGRRKATKDHDCPLTLYELAEMLQLQPHRVRDIAACLSLTRLSSDRTKSHSFHPSAIVQIRSAATDLISRRTASCVVGVPLREFNALCTAGMFVPFARFRGTTWMSDRFSSRQLSAVIERARRGVQIGSSATGVPLLEYCSISRKPAAEVIKQIHDGALRAVGWNEGKTGLQAYMLTRPSPMSGNAVAFRPRRCRETNGVRLLDAAIHLGVGQGAVRIAIAGGYLALARKTSDNESPSVDRDSLDRFNETFAAAKSYSSILACHPAQAGEKLRSLGIKRICNDVNFLNESFVRRSDVRRVLGPASDSKTNSRCERDRFWLGLRTHLVSVRSSNRLARVIENSEGRLVSGDGRSKALVIVDWKSANICFRVQAIRLRSPRKFLLLDRHLGELRICWPEAVVLREHNDDQITISESRRCPPLDKCGDWSETYSWVDDRMTRVRAIFALRREERSPSSSALRARMRRAPHQFSSAALV